MKFRAACIQTNTGADVAANLAAACDLVRRARDDGADLIALPETCNVMESNKQNLLSKVGPEADNPVLQAYKDLARQTGAWILLGSLVIKDDKAEKMANRSFLIDNDGSVRARYDKVHMFDVNLGGAEDHRESNHYQAGTEAVLASTPWCQLGMTICYDLRFADQFRMLAHGGAKVIATPSAFTRISGQAHWHILQRARAIETACFVIAPAQCGDHPGNRQTYGHSLIIDPWGNILADGGDQPGFIAAHIDLSLVDQARRKIPALSHDRETDLIKYS